MLSWGIKTCTPYTIVLLIRVRINETRLYFYVRIASPSVYETIEILTNYDSSSSIPFLC